MINQIPFTDFATEIKPLLSGFNLSYELENMQSSIVDSVENITDVVGTAIYDKAIEHYKSTDYNQADEDDTNLIRLNKLVWLVQDALINFAAYRHFIWFTIRVSNDGVTVKKNDDETTAFKYLTDEAKAVLIENAWSKISRLIIFLETEKAEFTEWTESEQYTELQTSIFDGSKDFKKYFSLENAAYFYVKARNEITEVVTDDLSPLIENLAELVTAVKGTEATDPQKTTMKLIKKFVAYRVVALCCFRFPYAELPAPIRQDIDNEMGRKDKDKSETTIKERISKVYEQKAEQYKQRLQFYLESLASTDTVATEVKTYGAYEQTEISKADNFYSPL